MVRADDDGGAFGRGVTGMVERALSGSAKAAGLFPAAFELVPLRAASVIARGGERALSGQDSGIVSAASANRPRRSAIRVANRVAV